MLCYVMWNLFTVGSLQFTWYERANGWMDCECSHSISIPPATKLKNLKKGILTGL